MNVNGILEALQQGQIPGSRSLSFALDSDSTLQVGNVIKGKVMRHYEGSRYAVEFGGRERVVDSSLPLKTGELIRGRVMVIDDKVHLQRLQAPVADSEQAAALLNRHLDGVNSPSERLALRLFEQYQAQITSGDLRHLGQLVAKAGQPELMALSALILSKMGVRLEPDFIRAIYRHLEQGRLQPRAEAAIPTLGTQDTAAVGNAAEQPVVGLLAAIMAQLHQQFSAPPPRAPAADGGKPDPLAVDDTSTGTLDDEQSQRGVSERLFNVQNDNAVAHRMVHFPLWLDDRLVEIEIAFFSQKHHGESADAALGPYRKIVFSLDTDHLGHVEVVVMLANKHARVEFISGDSAATAMLARHSTAVEAVLGDLGWHTDELRYSTTPDFEDGVLGAVVEHYITQDSFSRLM